MLAIPGDADHALCICAGVLAASRDMSVGDLVAVSTILEQPGSATTGVPRGAVLGDAAVPLLADASRSHLHLGKSAAAESLAVLLLSGQPCVEAAGLHVP